MDCTYGGNKALEYSSNLSKFIASNGVIKAINKDTVLYSNNNGTTNNITLSDSIVNYSYLEIEYYVVYTGANVYSTTGKIPVAGIGRIHLTSYFIGVDGSLVFNKRVNISGNSLNVVTDRTQTNNGPYSDGSYTYITKIIGYE